MTRFTLPALGMLAALLLLFAGAVGDLPSLRRDVPVIISSPAGGAISEIQPSPAVQSAPVTARNVDHQAANTAPDPGAAVAREQQELAAIRASADEARRDLADLREQREREQARLARLEASHASDMAQSSPAGGGSAPVGQPSASSETSAPTTPAVTSPSPPASPRATATTPVAPRERLLAARRLAAARAALADGRRARARWLLSTARTQMTQWASAADHAAALPAQGVDDALGLLNRGDRDGALRAIDQALAVASGGAGETGHGTD